MLACNLHSLARKTLHKTTTILLQTTLSTRLAFFSTFSTPQVSFSITKCSHFLPPRYHTALELPGTKTRSLHTGPLPATPSDTTRSTDDQHHQPSRPHQTLSSTARVPKTPTSTPSAKGNPKKLKLPYHPLTQKHTHTHRLAN